MARSRAYRLIALVWLAIIAPIAHGAAAEGVPQRTPVPSVPPAGARAEAFPPAPAPYREIVINVPGMRLYLYEDGVPIRDFPIAVGKIVTPSQMGGVTRIINRVIHPTYYPPDWYRRGLKPIPPGPDNPVGTRWLGLDIPGYGIHGTNDPTSIGKAVSGGCIRMYNADVEELAELVEIGTPVHFVYETVLVRRDPVLGQPFIRVFPDIYGLEEDRLGEALGRLAEIGVTPAEVETTGLAAMIEAADKTWHPVPRPLAGRWDGEALPHAFWAGPQPMVPVEPIARAIGSRLDIGDDQALAD
ncbi:MAG TPA: L,D-transpeptidase, partial [Limnochordia bacterium]